MKKYRSTETVSADQAVKRRVFTVDGCVFIAKPGEWVVWSDGAREGRPWICTDDLFQSSYEEEAGQ